jgi:hypothetical protein
VEADTAIGFSVAARRLADEARARGLVVPGFCSPPRLPDAVRALRRHPGAGTPIVAVRRRGRAGADVVADMIEGVVVANGLLGAAAQRVRAELRAATLRPGSDP